MSAIRKVRDLGRVIDGRIRKGWPFVRPEKSSKSVHKTKGLENRGHQCYRNAVLQCLLHTPEFYRYLVDRDDRCATPGDNCVFCALRGLAREYWLNGEDELQHSARDKHLQTERRYRALDNLNTAMNNHVQPDKAYPFLRSRKSKVNDMNASGQQDAHEFFLELANMLKYVNGDGPHEIRNIAMNRLFRLRVKKTWVCNDCGKAHVKPDKEIGLSLALPDNGKRTRDIQWYLERHFANETLQEVECDSDACKIMEGIQQRGDRERFTKIVVSPEILVIQLKRMRMNDYGKLRKVMDRVKCSDRLDLSEYSDGSLSYQLNGVVAHAGETLKGCHYVSMVRSQGGNGFVFCNDDNEIDDKKMKEQVVARAEGTEFQSYVLVYQKIGGRMMNCI